MQKVNQSINTSISSLPQAKVNLPHVHYRHDMGTTPPPVPQEKVRMCTWSRARGMLGRLGQGGFERILYAALYCFHVVQPVTKLACRGQWLIHTLRSWAWNERAGSTKAPGLMIVPWHHIPNTPPYKSGQMVSFLMIPESPAHLRVRSWTWDGGSDYINRKSYKAKALPVFKLPV